MNFIGLAGNLGGNAEVKEVKRGDQMGKMVKMSLATHENKNDTQWHNLVWYGCPDALIPLLTKGQPVSIMGSLKYNSKMDGDRRIHFKPDIIVNRLSLLGSKDAEGTQSEAEAAAPSEGTDFPQVN